MARTYYTSGIINTDLLGSTSPTDLRTLNQQITTELSALSRSADYLVLAEGYATAYASSGTLATLRDSYIGTALTITTQNAVNRQSYNNWVAANKPGNVLSSIAITASGTGTGLDLIRSLLLDFHDKAGLNVRQPIEAILNAKVDSDDDILGLVLAAMPNYNITSSVLNFYAQWVPRVLATNLSGSPTVLQSISGLFDRQFFDAKGLALPLHDSYGDIAQLIKDLTLLRRGTGDLALQSPQPQLSLIQDWINNVPVFTSDDWYTEARLAYLKATGPCGLNILRLWCAAVAYTRLASIIDSSPSITLFNKA